MKVLVTGGAGFIGSHTVDMLKENGYDVRIFDSLETQIHGNKKPSYLNSEAEFVQGDILNEKMLEKVLNGIDVVVHLAAMTGIGQSMYQPIRYLKTNTIGTATFYEVLMKNQKIRKNIKKIIVASSKVIYGEGAYHCKTHGLVYPSFRPVKQLERKDWELHCPVCDEHMQPVGITEEKPPQTVSTYALSKFDTEKLSLMFGNAFDIPTTVFRYFSVYGPRQSLSNPYTGVCSIFISRIKNNNPPTIFEDGNQIRDFIFVEDIARANLLAIEKSEKTDFYNVGTGVGTSINEVAGCLIQTLDFKIKPVYSEEFRIGDTRHDFASVDKIKKDLGFKPKWNFKNGLRELVKWSEEEKAIDKFIYAEKERKKFLG
jgi:dTDP-L-rhamnose 4-epimerase